MKQWKQAFYELLNANTLMAEVHLAFIGLSWGIWLLMPWHSFGTTPTFNSMAALAPEAVWGAIFALLGGMRLAGIYSQSHTWRTAAAILGTTLWAFAAMMFILANPLSTAVPVYSGLSLTSFWVAISLKAQGKPHE